MNKLYDFKDGCSYILEEVRDFAEKELNVDGELVGFASFNKNILVQEYVFDFYLRLINVDTAHYKKGTLVIARIGFLKTRQGFGSKLVSMLIKAGGECGYKYLALEQANPQSKSFAIKMGMKDIGENKDGRNFEMEI